MSETEQKLAEIRKRVSEASPPPWPLPEERSAEYSGNFRSADYDSRLPVDHEGCEVWPWKYEDDMIFAYRAREDVPWLLAYIDTLEAALESCRGDG